MDDVYAQHSLAFKVLGYIFTFASIVVVTWLLTPFVRIILGATPQIVKETTRSSNPKISTFIETLAYYFAPLRSNDSPGSPGYSTEEAFDDLVLPKEIKDSIIDLAFSVCAANKRNSPLRHVVLHGPDGGGKSMASKKLACVAGMDYACVDGRAVITTGEEAVSQMQTLFSWAKMSSNGMLLYIDEAEAFLGSQGSSLMSEAGKGHDAISIFLYNISKLRKGIILVLGTKRVQDLDSEVLSHFDEHIFLPLPDANCRKQMIQFYFEVCVQKYVEDSNASASGLKSKLVRFFTRQSAALLTIEPDILKGDQLEEIIAATRGFSGEDIRELMASMQSVFYGPENNGSLDFASCWSLVEAKAKHHRDSQVLAGEHSLSYLDGDLDLQDVTFV